MAEKQEQCCKACRWFKPYKSDKEHGDCRHPVPDAFRAPNITWMHSSEGTSCPTYQAKESK